MGKGADALAGAPGNESAPKAFVFVQPHALPERWRQRAIDYLLVPLLPGETESLLMDEPVASELPPDLELLADLVLRGASIQGMARELGITERSVQRRLGVLRAQFEVSSNAELAALLAERGFKE